MIKRLLTGALLALALTLPARAISPPFPTVWNAAYEAIPPDTESEALGAGRIRDLKFQLRSRLSQDMSWAGNGNDGFHNHITLLQQSTTPTPQLDAGVQAGSLFSEAANGNIELFYTDSNGHVTQVTNGGHVNFVVSPSTEPQRTVLNSSSGTYTTPSGATRLWVRVVGGGSGGGGAINNTASGNGGQSTFGTMSANGGAGSSNIATGAGGATSGCDIFNGGGSGQGAIEGSGGVPGGMGAPGPFGGGGGSFWGSTGIGGQAPGAGGGGGGIANGNFNNSGSGGSAGGYCEKMIVGPTATYSYTVGSGGNGASGGTAGGATGFGGGGGAAGVIIVDAYFD